MTDIEMIQELRKRGTTNGVVLGYHSGTMDIIADRFEELVNRNKELSEDYIIQKGLLDTYAASARSVKLNLKEFCEDDVPYPKMISDASRLASEMISHLNSRLDSSASSSAITVKAFLDLIFDTSCNRIHVYSKRTGQFITNILNYDKNSIRSIPAEILSMEIVEMDIDSSIYLYVKDTRIPVGRIDYLSFKGEVKERIEYYNVEKFIKDVKDNNFYGVPMVIVLYKDKNGNTPPKDFLSSLDPLPQGVEFIDNPCLGEVISNE
ncbi:MAG: hypothetical protein IJA32_11045 [Lachnospiraceae bacterium]|nr:hypothetical protein [Lachnospiraceae bacterium]